MGMFENMALHAIDGHLPADNDSFVWQLKWLFEDDTNGVPLEFHHKSPRECINHFMQLWNSGRNLVFLSFARQNA